MLALYEIITAVTAEPATFIVKFEHLNWIVAHMIKLSVISQYALNNKR